MNLGKIYRKSLDIALKYKPLWVIGIAVYVFAGGGCNSSQNLDLGDSADFGKIQESVDPQKFNELVGFLRDLFRSIPPWIWAVFIFSLLLAVIAGFIFNLIARNWAVGSLIGGIDDAYNEKEVTLKTSSQHGIRSLPSLIWLSIVPWLLYFLFLVIPGLLIVFSFIIFVPLGIFALFFLGFFAMCGSLVIAAVQIWATRVAVIENKSGKEAFLEGWEMTKRHLTKTIGLGCANTCLGCLSGCLFSSIIGMVVLYLILSVAGTFYFAATNLILFISILIIVLITFGAPFILFTTLFNGIYAVFNYSTWNVLYRGIKEEKADD